MNRALLYTVENVLTKYERDTYPALDENPVFSENIHEQGLPSTCTKKTSIRKKHGRVGPSQAGEGLDTREQGSIMSQSPLMHKAWRQKGTRPWMQSAHSGWNLQLEETVHVCFEQGSVVTHWPLTQSTDAHDGPSPGSHTRQKSG